jgi:DUF4097 and DUF4098 domain-containing protein YvlB
MEPLTFATTDSPRITLEHVAGSLRLSGWDQNQLHVESDDRTTKVEPRGDEFVIATASDCTMHVPRQAHVKVINLGGDARVKALQGSLEIDVMNGDLTLRQTGAVKVDRVSGDVSAKKVFGSLIVKEVSGDFSVRGVSGDAVAERVSGDVYLRDVVGNARAVASGSVILNLEFKPNQNYDFKASDDVLCRIAPNTSAKITAQFNGDVSVDVAGAKVEGNGGQRVITLGDGASQVRLRAAGDVSITSSTRDPEAMSEHFGDEFGVMAEELSAHIESQIEAHMSDLEKHLSHIGGAKGDRVSARVQEAMDRARRKAEAVRQRAQSRSDAVQRRAEAKIEAIQRRAEAKAERGKRFGFKIDLGKPFAPPFPPMPPTPLRPPRPASEPVSDEERMTILRMVEQKKISIEEAEKLLAALEGKGKS